MLQGNPVKKDLIEYLQAASAPVPPALVQV